MGTSRPTRIKKIATQRREGRSKGYGWIPDLPDQRDFLYAAPMAFLRALPDSVDLRSQCPPVYDQGQLGSCTANAIGGAIEFDQMKENLPQVFIPSRLFIYYNERVLEDTVNSDSGAMIRDGIKSVSKQGACPEPLWPYQIDKFRAKPSASCYTEAAKHTAASYQRLIQSQSQMLGCLASGTRSCSALPFTRASKVAWWRAPDMRPCRARVSAFSAVTQFAPSAMIMTSAGLSAGIAGGLGGVCAATSLCLTIILLTLTWRRIFGQ